MLENLIRNMASKFSFNDHMNHAPGRVILNRSKEKSEHLAPHSHHPLFQGVLSFAFVVVKSHKPDASLIVNVVQALQVDIPRSDSEESLCSLVTDQEVNSDLLNALYVVYIAIEDRPIFYIS